MRSSVCVELFLPSSVDVAHSGHAHILIYNYNTVIFNFTEIISVNWNKDYLFYNFAALPSMHYAGKYWLIDLIAVMDS